MPTTRAKNAPSWYLEDGVKIAQRNPYTFSRPSTQAISLLKPDDHVQLIFQLKRRSASLPSGERMWVRIKQIRGKRYRGCLTNEPTFIGDLSYGADVTFTASRIISVSLADPVPDPTLAYRARCAVTMHVLSGFERVGCLTRRKPERPDDSGWLLYGQERDGHCGFDGVRWEVVSLGAVLRVDDSFVTLLKTPAPCFFRRRPDGTFARLL